MPHASLFPDDTASAAPQTGWITAHCDGGARGNPGPAGFGAVLQDDSGHILAELSEFLGHRTNNFAEYAGLLGCLQWALDHHITRLRVVSDSLLMVKQIQGKFKINSPDLKPLWEEARRRIAQIESSHPQARFEITHALRHKNKAADRLANEAMDRASADPARGNADPARGNADPARGNADPARGNADPARGNADPARGNADPARGNADPARTSGQTRSLSSRPERSAAERPAAPVTQATMLRGFTRDGSIHLLGGTTLPDGIFVKIIPE